MAKITKGIYEYQLHGHKVTVSTYIRPRKVHNDVSEWKYEVLVIEPKLYPDVQQRVSQAEFATRRTAYQTAIRLVIERVLHMKTKEEP